MKLGIVGSGYIVKEFLDMHHELPEIKISALCGRNTEAVEELADKYSIADKYCIYEEFLKSKIDTVYVALPNSLHFEYAKKALLSGKHVIVEKPFTVNLKQAEILKELAKEKKLFLFEAITTLYHFNYQKMKENLTRIGEIKIVNCNYSQYSSRYDRFKQGIILPAFDPKLAGGAFMDLNIYNIHYVVGLFGKPKDVTYYPNIENKIDTSGILIMDYGKFKCSCIAAKDCGVSPSCCIEGNEGYIHQNSAAGICRNILLHLNDGTEQLLDDGVDQHRMTEEFLAFDKMIKEQDFKSAQDYLELTMAVCEVQTMARQKAGMLFPCEEAF